MILNEDFFDDIEIKNDDLKSNNPELYNDTHKNIDARTLLKDMFSSYKHCLYFTISIPYSREQIKRWNLFDKTDEWNLFRTVKKRICNVFDAYDIKYSEPFFCTSYDFDAIYNKMRNGSSLDIINIESNKVFVTDTDNIEEYKHLELSNRLSMFMFVDLPEFSTLKKSYRFIYRFANSLQNILIDDSDVVVYNTNDDNQRMSPTNIFLTDVHIKNIMKGKIQQIKNSILCLLFPEYKYRKEFKKMKTESELQDFIKNH